MKILNTPYMRKLLKSGVNRVRRDRRRFVPSDGNLQSVLYFRNRSGWHYQVDCIHDTRFRPRPYVSVFAFHPKTRGCESATYLLTKEV